MNKIVKNTSWIIIINIIQLLISLVVNSITARYLGPNNYGNIYYAISFVSFFISLATLGFNNIAIKEIIDNKGKEGIVIGTMIFMRFISSLSCIVFIVFLSFIMNKGNVMLIILTTIYSLTLVFQSFDSISYWYQSQLNSKVSLSIKLITFSIISIYKIVLVVLNKSIYLFVLSYVLESLIIAILLLYLIRKEFKIKLNLKLGKEMLNKSKSFIISGIMVALYLQIDKIMIGQMMDTTSVGIYSSAVNTCSMWTFILIAIIESNTPSLFSSLKDGIQIFNVKIKQLYNIIIYITVFVFFMFLIFGELIIYILYGVEYMEAKNLINILTVSTLFSYIGVISNLWLISTNNESYVKYISFVGALVNIVLNFILIPMFGMIGASIATILTQFIANFVFVFMVKDLRPLGLIIFNSFNISILMDNVKKLVLRKV